MSTKEYRIALLEKSIESTKANWRIAKEEIETLTKKSSAAAVAVTELTKEFYDKGYAAGYTRGMNSALKAEYKELTGQEYQPLKENENQYVVPKEPAPSGLGGGGGVMAPKDMIGAGLGKFGHARDDSSSGGDSDEWDSD